MSKALPIVPLDPKRRLSRQLLNPNKSWRVLHEIHNPPRSTALGVGFVSLTEALDLTTPTGRALTGMLAVFAEFERDILRERVQAGMAQARKNGKAIGRPATARAKADKIQELFSQGLSKQQIAERLHIGRASVFRAIAA